MATRSRPLFTVALLAVALQRVIPAGAQERTLSPSDIDDAIRWGETSNPSPYPLHHAFREGTASDVVVGAVYTPFVRVALAAKAAFNTGQHLDKETLAPPLLEPVFYVAFRWYCCDDVHGDQWAWHPLEPLDYYIGIPGQSWGWARNIMARPLWVRGDLSVLNGIGGPPFSDTVLVAGYPMAALSQPSDFVIYREIPNPVNPLGPATDAHVGRVTVADMQAWR